MTQEQVNALPKGLAARLLVKMNGPTYKCPREEKGKYCEHCATVRMLRRKLYHE